MEKEFVPYELSLKLKELGFNEPCIASYSTLVTPIIGALHQNDDLNIRHFAWAHSKNSALTNINSQPHNPHYEVISAPLWQQAFDYIFLHFNPDTAYSLEQRFDGVYIIFHRKEILKFDDGVYTRQTCMEFLLKILTYIKNKKQNGNNPNSDNK